MHCARDGTGRRPLRRPPDSRVPSRAQHPRRWPPLPACSSHRTAPARAAASPRRRYCPRWPARRNSLPSGCSRALAAAQAAAAASAGSQQACVPPRPPLPLACVPTARLLALAARGAPRRSCSRTKKLDWMGDGSVG
ncbi:hypothetical protein PVAP13_7KG057729 [Panicum virgatum]|uniref:Uncharacterized protein n=1 Tax=Panicum virgatum TaxID=38727 RepID=A0A8T0Q8C6_PANVG|nr:hypothetical protein PVAP13_7KG057729 [Panicum virgatum]